jgi:hypothetical protein
MQNAIGVYSEKWIEVKKGLCVFLFLNVYNNKFVVNIVENIILKAHNVEYGKRPTYKRSQTIIVKCCKIWSANKNCFCEGEWFEWY